MVKPNLLFYKIFIKFHQVIFFTVYSTKTLRIRGGTFESRSDGFVETGDRVINPGRIRSDRNDIVMWHVPLFGHQAGIDGETNPWV